MTACMDENGECLSLGSWLQSAREERGESLDEAARVTRIGKGYLEALEAGEVHKLPSEAYAKGFVRLYATHLGLSGDEAVTRLLGERAPAAVTQGAGTTITTAGEHPVVGRVNISYRRWTIPLTLLLLLLVLATIFRLKNDYSGKVSSGAPATQAPVPASTQLPVTTLPPGQQVTPATPPADTEQTSLPPETTPPQGIILRLKVVQAGKLHITIDGAVSQEYDLNVGDLVEWKAEKMLLLDLDNAGSVEGDLNGKPLQPFGEPGRAAHLVIEANGVRQE